VVAPCTILPCSTSVSGIAASGTTAPSEPDLHKDTETREFEDVTLSSRVKHRLQVEVHSDSSLTCLSSQLTFKFRCDRLYSCRLRRLKCHIRYACMHTSRSNYTRDQPQATSLSHRDLVTSCIAIFYD
jgi:hypothetical protein